MKRLIIGLSLLMATSAAAMQDTVPVKRGWMSTHYHSTHDRLSKHKGKVGLAVGAIGTGLVIKIFNKEINDYVKPFIKSVWKKTTGWIKRIFRSEKKA